MKRILSIISAAFLLLSMLPLAPGLSEGGLPEGYPRSEGLKAFSASVETAAGKRIDILDRTAGENTIIVYGRATCYNTLSFLDALQSSLSRDALSRAGVKVLAVLFPSEGGETDLTDFSQRFPGISYVKVFDNNGGMWQGLRLFGKPTNYVSFPAVFLQDRENNLVYCSTGYVWEPYKVVATAVEMAAALSPQPPQASPGDLNEDGAVDGRDLLRLAKYLAGQAITVQKEAADVNGDGTIDGRDLLGLAKYLAGLKNSLR